VTFLAQLTWRGKSLDYSKEPKQSMVLKGTKPDDPPLRNSEFEDLEKKMIDVLVDAIKYIATTSGIVIAIYSQILQNYLKSPNITLKTTSQVIIFMPLIFWFLSIVGTVIGIYPRHYRATTDLEKQKAINSIRETKRFWLVIVLYLFLAGFSLFLYVLGAQIWKIYPFS